MSCRFASHFARPSYWSREGFTGGLSRGFPEPKGHCGGRTSGAARRQAPFGGRPVPESKTTYEIDEASLKDDLGVRRYDEIVKKQKQAKLAATG